MLIQGMQYQSVRWVPYVVTKEIAQNIKEKPEKNVIRTSTSLCGSYDFFVTLCFSVDYQHSKLCYQIGQILSDDLLDHLG